MTLPSHLRRGAVVGALGGIGYGLFVAFVGGPLVAHAESFESGGGEAAVSAPVTAAGSVVAGLLWGLLFGVVAFGIAYYLLEPAIPGRRDTKSYLLGGAGFVTVSGAPWIGLPPQPPGIEQALPTETRLVWYAAFALAGAAACGLSGYLYGRLDGRGRAERVVAAAAPFALLAVPWAAMPANPTSGPVPPAFVAGFRGAVALGQVGLWFVMASAHAWLVRRADDGAMAASGFEATAD